MSRNLLTAYCGLDCEACEARKATLTNNDELRKEVSRKWCKMNNTDQITPETINCMGCRAEGVKFAYCDYICPIRKCAAGKSYETCADCSEKATCDKLAPFMDNDVVRKNLDI